MKKEKIFVICVLILLLTNLLNVSVKSEREPAEINCYVTDNIPAIQINNWTAIKFTLEDRCGINWTQLKKAFGLELNPGGNRSDIFSNFRQYFQKYKTLLLWKYVFHFPEPIQSFLGNTSFKLTPSVIGKNNKGWEVKIIPNIINNSSTGNIHDFTLYAKVDDSLLDYSVTVEINCTRIDTLGGIYGISYVYLPLKVSPKSFFLISNLNQEKIVAPKSKNNITFNLTNTGYYRNVFYLDIKTNNSNLYAAVHQQATVIDPGEKKQIKLSFLTPEKFIDFGTPYIIDVYAAHSLNSTFIKLGSLTIINKGIYLSPLLILIIILFAIFTLFSTFVLRKILFKFQQYKFGRPNKPWTIPDENKLLKKLKRVNRKKYVELKTLMKEEHQSSIYWFKSYRKKMKKLEK